MLLVAGVCKIAEHNVGAVAYLRNVDVTYFRLGRRPPDVNEETLARRPLVALSANKHISATIHLHRQQTEL